MEAGKQIEASPGNFGQRSAASEHEDREAIEETGRGDRKVGADAAGTAMALRGEHDVRLASTSEDLGRGIDRQICQLGWETVNIRGVVEAER